VRDPLKKAYFALQHTKTLRELRKSAVCFDGWLVISEMEAESLRGYFPRVPIGVVGNSLSSTRVRSDIHSRPKQIVLIGNFDYYPNVDAAVYFATEIMPLLRRSQEGCLLRIIGKNPPSRLCRLAAADIEVTGYVEDLPAAVAEGSVFVCPLRIGTGIKNKVIEAMGCGVPVVSTGLGVEGTSAVSGVHYLQAESAHEFADCISRLLQNPRLCGTLTHNARDLVHECFSPAVPRQQLGAFFGRLGLMNQTSVVGR
jgi:glycosyltransferase involved in cell wall biosynthesis